MCGMDSTYSIEKTNHHTKLIFKKRSLVECSNFLESFLSISIVNSIIIIMHYFKSFHRLHFSFLLGIGVGLATSAAFVALNHYFKNKRGQAVGLSMAGTALGMLILPQLVSHLLDWFAFSGAILVLAGLALHATFGSTLLQPVKWHLKEEIIDVEMASQTPYMETLKEDEDDDLPEMKTLLFPPPSANGRQMRKNFSEVAISSMNKGMTKRPTFPRIMSNGSNMAANGVLSNTDLSSSIRRRKASVMSQISTLDFMGSNLLVHVNVSFE